jgi:hypothetical protein
MGTTTSIPTEVRLANQQLLETVGQSYTEIPPIFALMRYPNGAQDGKYGGILISASKVPNYSGVWKLDILKNPYNYLDNGHLVAEETDHWFYGKLHPYLAVTENHVLVPFKIQYHHSILRVGGSNQMIPVCYIPDASKVIGHSFLQIDRSSMRNYRIELKPGPLRLPTLSQPSSVSPSAPAALPVAPVVSNVATKKKKQANILSQFIVNELVEGIIARGIDCPITMEKMTRENVRVLPCGHSVSSAAVEHFPRDARSCPQCRKPFSLSQVQQWK